MTIYAVRHNTIYRYYRPVKLGRHHLLFRPRVGAIDQDAADAHVIAHLAKGDFLGSHDRYQSGARPRWQ
jgi:transglutaminase superfamily protein